MKKYFFNEDGTIKMINMLIAIIVILVLAVILIYFLLFNGKNITEGGKTITSKDVTSTINMCKDCNMEFKEQELVLVTNQEYPLEEIINVQNISLASVKFDVGSTDYISVETSKKNGLVLKTKDMIGETTLKASYDKINISIRVVVNAGEILSLNLVDHPYYIYLNKETPIEIDSNPKGLDTSELNFSVSNDIITIKDGNIIGNALGSAKLYLTVDENIYEQDVYVVNDKIDVQIKKNNNLESVYAIKVDKKEDIDIIVTLDDNSNIGLTNEMINIEHIDEGISGVIEYDGKNLGVDRSYKYRISINTLEDNGKMTIKFNHPDGTSRFLIVYNDSE